MGYRRGGLDLSRPGPGAKRRRRRRRALRHMRRRAVVFLFAAAFLLLPVLSAQALALPARLQDAFFRQVNARCAARLAAAEEEAFSLRMAAGRAGLLQQETDALRALAGAGQLPPGDGLFLTFCPRTALWPGGFSVSGRGLTEGQALLDGSGRFAGVVSSAAKNSAAVAMAGSSGCRAACLAGDTAGTLVRRDGALFLTGLPCDAELTAGTVVVTLGNGACRAGLWAGRLAAAPAPDASGLTASAPLTECAAPCARYFAISP